MRGTVTRCASGWRKSVAAARHARHAPRPRARLAGAQAALLALLLGAVLTWGAVFGNDVLHPFLLWTWNA